MNGTTLVEKIDAVLKEKNLKRQILAEYCGLTPQAISDWSKKGSIPGANVALKIAEFLGVSLEWLLSDDFESRHNNYFDKDLNDSIGLAPSSIMQRVEVLLREKVSFNYSIDDGSLFEPILEIVTLDEIKSFFSNRLEPKIQQLYRIAKKLNVSIDWLITEKSDVNITKANIQIYRLAMDHSQHLYNFSCLHETDQKIIEDLTSNLFESRRKIRERMQSLNIDVKKIPEVYP